MDKNKKVNKILSFAKGKSIEDRQCYNFRYIHNTKTNEITFISGYKMDVSLDVDSDLEPVTGMRVTSQNGNDSEDIITFLGVPDRKLFAAFEAFEKSKTN